jgi:hypothetical protein
VAANFTEELGYWKDGKPPAVGTALLRAKQRYYNNIGSGSLNNYDEKSLGVMTLYGLPMLKVRMPMTTSVAPGNSLASMAVQTSASPAQMNGGGVTTSTVSLPFSYIAQTGPMGTYYTIAGASDPDVQVAGGRPVMPRSSVDVNISGTIAHGVLMLGGTFSDQPVDPVISRIVTDEIFLDIEPPYPSQQWYPTLPGSINRFLSIDDRSNDRLVVVPGQFKATNLLTPTVGTQRLYSALEFEVYHAPFTATDYLAPRIWQVEAYSTSTTLRFRIQVDDNSGSIQRAVMLYRALNTNTWSRAELAFNQTTGWAEGQVGSLQGPFEYFAQAVDLTGNVTLALDRGNPFRYAPVYKIYLPLVLKN